VHLAACVLSFLAAPLAAQAVGAPAADTGRANWLTRRLGGQAQAFSEMYGVDGLERRRPGSTWRLMATPRLALVGSTEVGFDLLLSSEGNSARQSINQFAFEPTWGWGQLHLGDFARDYSPYTMQGLRIRGFGLDVDRTRWRASVQGGRSAALITTADGPQYRRSVIAGAVGLGRAGERSLDLRIVRAQDALIPDEQTVFDTLGLDTLPADLRPEQRTRPQEKIERALGGSLRRQFDDNIRRAGLSDWVETHQGTAGEIAAGCRRPIDMLFLDGDQSPAGARLAYERWAPFLRRGGIIALHNSRSGSYGDGHDGHRRLVVETIRPPEYADVRCVGTTTFARKTSGR